MKLAVSVVFVVFVVALSDQLAVSADVVAVFDQLVVSVVVVSEQPAVQLAVAEAFSLYVIFASLLELILCQLPAEHELLFSYHFILRLPSLLNGSFDSVGLPILNTYKHDYQMEREDSAQQPFLLLLMPFLLLSFPFAISVFLLD